MMADKQRFIQMARALFQEEKYAILSTNSVRMPAFPLGSLTAYCLDKTGNPVVLINSVGQEAENIVESRQVSLAVTEKRTQNLNDYLGVTCLAEATRPAQEELEELAESYYHYFPEFTGYHETSEFNFYVLELREIRIQRGFQPIFWIRPDDFFIENPFSKSVAQRIMNHMNEDHQDALKTMLAERKDHYANGKPVEMIGINSEGFDVRVDSEFFRIHFDEPVTTMLEARKALMELSNISDD